MKAATFMRAVDMSKITFQSTPPVKAATVNLFFDKSLNTISIHAAREGGDFTRGINAEITDISIHAAREGGDCGNE